MPILNYTTKIDVDKTTSEIAKMLSLAGAIAILTEYDREDNYIKSISFTLPVGDNVLQIKLPCDWKPMLEILEKDRKVPRNLKTREQAVRVSWRIVKNWVEAQLAIIETKMVKTEEVFLPYIVGSDGRTLYERISSNNFLLESGK